MARLAALEKMLFFPTDLETIELLVERHIRVSHHFWKSSPVSTFILDPCVGDGKAVDLFARTLSRVWAGGKQPVYKEYVNQFNESANRVSVKGVELDDERVREAKELLGDGNVLHSAFEYVSSVGQFNLLLMNPPYTYYNGRRVELTWVEMAAPFLANNGMMVLIVPDMFVANGKYCSEMSNMLKKCNIGATTVLRFPDHSYPQFKQVVIMGHKYGNGTVVRVGSDLRVEGVIGECDITYSHDLVEVTQPTLTKAIRNQAKPSVFDNAAFPKSLIDLIGDPTGQANAMRPLTPMRREHAAMVAAAGMFNGAVINGKVIKGSTIKRVIEQVTHSETDAGTAVTEKVQAEVLAAQLSTIDLQTGEIALVNSMDNKKEFEELLSNHAEQFVGLAEKLYPPLFTEEHIAASYGKALEQVHAPRKIKGQQNGMFPQQVFRAASILYNWRRNKVTTVVGEMGVGKTIVSMAAATVQVMARKPHNRKVIVLLPPKEDLVKKWEEEIKLALREFNPHVVHVETISDVQAAFAHKGLTFILLKETTAKMSSGWKAVRIPEPRQPKKSDVYRPPKCPKCGSQLAYTEEDPDKVKAFCANEDCNDPLWTVARRVAGNGTGNSQGYARYPLARYIRDHFNDRYTLILDEAHNFKAGDSARAYAAQDLLTSCNRAVQMTGTLYNGMASSIFYLLWRALPDFRAVWGWGDVQSFINKYGLFETTIRTYDKKARASTSSGYKDFSERKSERPGIHPAMVALLLPTTVFFGIRDLEIILPPYSENTLFVPRPQAFNRIEGYLNMLKGAAVQKMMQEHDYSILAQFTWAKQGAWDMASLGDAVEEFGFGPIECPWEMWPKEEALLRLVAREKRAGRPVLCFVGQINRRDVTGRLCELLERYGMKGAVMRANEKSRVEFVRHALKRGVDVIFTSAQLVKEGIDLLELPTFVWYAGENNIYLVQQANRRSWRPGQDLPVDIYYLAYNNTPQAETMSRTANKLAAAQTIAGDVRQGLAAILGETDFVSRLQDAVISTEHFESSLTLDDLPELVPFEVAATPQVDVEVTVKTRAFSHVRVTVTVEELKDFSQLSLF